MLTYHIPEKAQTHFTTRMELENTSEAICPAFWNKWTRVYASIQDKEVRLSLAARQQWLHSSPNLPDLRKTRKGNSQDVVKTHTTKGNAVNQRTGYLLHGGERWDKPKLPKKCWALFIQVNTRCFNICQQE